MCCMHTALTRYNIHYILKIKKYAKYPGDVTTPQHVHIIETDSNVMVGLDEMLEFHYFLPICEFLQCMVPSSPADFEATSEIPEIQVPFFC